MTKLVSLASLPDLPFDPDALAGSVISMRSATSRAADIGTDIRASWSGLS